MSKSPYQKLKLLALAEILQEQSDEAHPLTIQQLIGELTRYDITAERKSLYDDIDALMRFGMDIVVVKGRSNAYYLGERTFQLPELKLLVDAALSAKFITEKKSAQLIKKISQLTSRHEAQMLQRQVFVQGRVKTMNESIYYTVDLLQNAIAQNKKIQCRYAEWAIDPRSPRLFEKRWRRGGALYRISPWALLWDDENYYLVAFDDEAGQLKHYRVDKLAQIELLPQPRGGQSAFEKLDMAEYTKRRFGMFGGEETDITIRFTNRLIGVVVDRFGKDVHIRLSGAAHFTATLRAVPGPQFTAWAMGFGEEAKVLSPQSVVDDVRKTLQRAQSQYT